MLAIIRVILVIILASLICIVGILHSLLRPFHPNNVYFVTSLFVKLAPIVGLTVEQRYPKQQYNEPCIYIANHQNNYDMLTISGMTMPRTVSIGKKSLLWIPLFGLLFWITGNILIEREKKSKARTTILKVANKIKQKNISILMFPEGTRSRGRGLLPFKMGAFVLAIEAGVPVVPVVCSSLYKKVKLNRWNNGLVITEILEPIDTSNYNQQNVKELANNCHAIVKARIEELDNEIASREKKV